MATKEELVQIASEAKADANKAQKAFEGLRAGGSAEELVKAAHAATTAIRTHAKAQHEADTFELVGVYEGIRLNIMPLVTNIVKDGAMALLGKHEVSTIVITVPVSTDAIEPDKIVVNTLGKRTVVKSGGGNGSRTRYVYGPDRLNSRQLVETHGTDEVGAEKTAATLAEPSKFGLTHLADRIAKKLDFDKVPA